MQSKRKVRASVLIGIILLSLVSCTHDGVVMEYDFDHTSDRVWIGEDFWGVPLEDWSVRNSRIEFSGTGQQNTCSYLTGLINSEKGDFSISFDMGLIDKGNNPGSSGVIIGSAAPEEESVKAAVYFGRGLNLGITTDGYIFAGQARKKLPDNFSYESFRIKIDGSANEEGFKVSLYLADTDDNTVGEVSVLPEQPVKGIVQMVNNFRNADSKNNGPSFWFDNIKIEGKGSGFRPENRFGPVLWTMHTLSRNILKLTAQLPPVGEDDNRNVALYLLNNGKWEKAGEEDITADSRTATFRIGNWNPMEDKEYKVVYEYTDLSGKETIHEYTGTIRQEPVDRPVRMGAMTCQYHTGFPYSPVVSNLNKKNPDILYFSGDQIYEQNGGYPIKREPEDQAILNYLGKWYMFGWAFGEQMRNIPTICTPDDHDVFQGNIWGGEGIPKPSGLSNTDDYMGFTQTVKFVNVVNRTQCAHLPDPYDPTPIEQGMSVWYTSLNYGRVSFAIVSDRIFKSGPNLVSTWEGRKDHLKEPLKDPSVIDKPGLQLLGPRQEKFLEEWIMDWKDVDMKVLLSQTLLANTATHHGTYDGYLLGDLDSGGWPKKARDRALGIIRKGFVFHICGDQHVPSIIKYGIDNFRDAGWAYCTPAIAVGYSRWFRPDELSIPVKNRPEHGLPNTGEYTDAFGNKNFVYAIGNPRDFNGIQNRYEYQHMKTGGLGFVIFNTATREITIESWHFNADVDNPSIDCQHPGWPLTINQFDNYSREAVAWLPKLVIKGDSSPVVGIFDDETGELVYMVRIKGNDFTPGVFSTGKHTIRIGYPEQDKWTEKSGIVPLETMGEEEIIVEIK